MSKINLADLASKDPKVKYNCTKNVLAVARDNPAEIYPDLNFFSKLLDSDNNILKWTAIDVLGYVAGVAPAKRVDAYLGKLYGFLNAGNLITANHAITALAEVAVSRPEHRQRITDELLKVEHYHYDTDECRNIATGKVILAISTYFDKLESKDKVMQFVRRQAKNTRNATRKKAEQFLKRTRP